MTARVRHPARRGKANAAAGSAVWGGITGTLSDQTDLQAALDAKAEELSDLTDVNTSTPTNRNFLIADGTDWESRALVEADVSDLGNYLENIVEDLTPQLGGTLDTNGNLIDSDGGIVALSPTADTTTPILTLITEASNVDRRLINFWEENASGDDGFWLQYSGVPATPGNRLVFGSDKPSAAAEILALGERGQVWIPADLGNDASYSSTDHPFQIGLSSGTNLRMDNNEILAVNNGAASTLFLQGDGGDLNYGGNATSTSKDVDWYLAGGTMRLHSVASASEAEFSWSGTDFQITGASTADDIQFIGWDSVQIRSGMDFFILDAAANSWSQMSHGGTDFDWAFTGTTDMNLTGLTAINAGTVDADFDALTATSFGGIASANLVDKSANETITGNWTFDIDSIADFNINRTNTTSESAIQFSNNDGAKGYIGVDDNGQFNFRDVAQSIKLFIDASGNLVADGDLSGATIGGIAEANLLDKTAAETVSGAYEFTVAPKTLVAGGGSGYFLKSTENWVSGTLNLPSLRWQESDGTSHAMIRAHTTTGANSILELGTGFFTPLLSLRSTQVHDLEGSITISGGATFESAIDFGNVTAATTTDLSDHIALWGSIYGFNITSNSLNVVSNGINSVQFRSTGTMRVLDSGGTDYAEFSHDGTDFNLDFTNTTEFNINDVPVLFAGEIRAAIGGNQTDPKITFAGDEDTGLYRNTADELSITAGANRQILITNGAVTIDDELRIDVGSEANPSLNFDVDTDTGIYRAAANELGFVAGGTDRARVRATDIQTDVPVRILEAASAPADIATYGTVWVRSDTPNVLMFTDDAGTDFRINSNVNSEVETQLKVKPSSESRTSTTTFADDDTLAGFEIKANTFYAISGLILMQTSDTPDFKMQMLSDQTPASMVWTFDVIKSNDETFSSVEGYSFHSSSETITVSTSSVGNVIRVNGYIQGHATLDGTLDFRWAQNTSSASATTVLGGSWLRIERVV